MVGVFRAQNWARGKGTSQSVPVSKDNLINTQIVHPCQGKRQSKNTEQDNQLSFPLHVCRKQVIGFQILGQLRLILCLAIPEGVESFRLTRISNQHLFPLSKLYNFDIFFSMVFHFSSFTFPFPWSFTLLLHVLPSLWKYMYCPEFLYLFSGGRADVIWDRRRWACTEPVFGDFGIKVFDSVVMLPEIFPVSLGFSWKSKGRVISRFAPSSPIWNRNFRVLWQVNYFGWCSAWANTWRKNVLKQT